jgi:hypothetical protein
MSKLECVSCFAGITLIAGAAAVIRNRGNIQNVSGRRRRSVREAPVEQLAERLKQAWAEHHTQA